MGSGSSAGGYGYGYGGDFPPGFPQQFFQNIPFDFNSLLAGYLEGLEKHHQTLSDKYETYKGFWWWFVFFCWYNTMFNLWMCYIFRVSKSKLNIFVDVECLLTSQITNTHKPIWCILLIIALLYFFFHSSSRPRPSSFAYSKVYIDPPFQGKVMAKASITFHG